jgi:hypothetical protein
MCRNVYMAPVLRRSRPLLSLKIQYSDYYISEPGIKTRSDQYAAPREHANRGEGYQELIARGSLPGSGCADMDVCTSRFELLSYLLGPQGRRVAARRLQQRLRRL